jgi:hypothetical protein
VALACLLAGPRLAGDVPVHLGFLGWQRQGVQSYSGPCRWRRGIEGWIELAAAGSGVGGQIAAGGVAAYSLPLAAQVAVALALHSTTHLIPMA